MNKITVEFHETETVFEAVVEGEERPNITSMTDGCYAGPRMFNEFDEQGGRSIKRLATSAYVQVFGCRDAEILPSLGQPASEKRQGTKSRGVGH
jgi:hypothetical protein